MQKTSKKEKKIGSSFVFDQRLDSLLMLKGFKIAQTFNSVGYLSDDTQN